VTWLTRRLSIIERCHAANRCGLPSKKSGFATLIVGVAIGILIAGVGGLGIGGPVGGGGGAGCGWGAEGAGGAAGGG